MPAALDLALVALFAIALPLYFTFHYWPRARARILGGAPGARLAEYRLVMFEQWAIAAAAVGLWAWAGRGLPSLGLAWPEGWRLILSAFLVAALAVLYVVQVRGIAANVEVTRRQVGPTLEPLRALLPHTRAEFHAFVAVSVTAGVCEELLFRGYLVGVLRPWLGFWGAGVLGTVLFGLAHAYQGTAGIVRTGLVGLVMLVVFAITQSLVPGMLLHTIIDIGGGATAWLLLREPATAAAPRAATA